MSQRYREDMVLDAAEAIETRIDNLQNYFLSEPVSLLILEKYQDKHFHQFSRSCQGIALSYDD